MAVTSYLLSPTDSFTSLSSVASGNVYTTNTAYDALGRSVSIVNPDSSWTHTVYTKAGRVDRVSRPGGTSDSDSTVAWTRSLYDAAGRQTTTTSDYDMTGSAGIAIEGFEGDSAGWDEGSSAVMMTGSHSTMSLDSGTWATVHTGTGSLLVNASANGGALWTLPGTFVSGHPYHASVWVYALNGSQIQAALGLDASGGFAQSNVPQWSSTGWRKIDIDWTPSSSPSAGSVKLAVLDTGTSGVVFRLDDVSVWDTQARSGSKPNPANVPSSVTVFDPRGKVIESIAAPDAAGDPAPVTASTYDQMGRLTRVTVNTNVSVSGNGTGNDTNLLTTYGYDDLGRKTDTTDPALHATHLAYDRLGRVTDGYVAWNGTSSSLSIHTIAAYDALGELVGTCSPNAVSLHSCDPSATGDTYAWHYAYDAMGHQITATPPVNAVSALAITSATYELGGAGRLNYTTDRVSGTAIRRTTYTYDALGRQTAVAVAPKPSGTALTTTATLDSLGHQATIAVSGTSTDTLAETYDEMGRLTSVSRGGTAITAYVYNPDGTAASRTDNNTTTSTFTYTSLGQLASATVPGDATGVAYTWGLDGNMASRTWGAYVSGTYAYDGAKRPVTLAIKFGTSSMGTIGRTYDVAGNVTSETQTLTRTGGGGTRPTLAYGHTESFTYDAANRVAGSSFDGTTPETRTYTYDADSNRTVVYEAGVTFYYFYDNTDELIKKGPNPNGTGASALAYDGLGNITTNQPGGPDSNSMLATTYTYDPAGHLLTIDDGTPSQKVVFTIDAAGRHFTQTIGTGAATTYAYLGTSDQITTTSQSGTTTYSAIDAIGDRLDQGSTSSIAGWLVPDLHGNIAAAVSAGAGPVYLTAYRYDPYGETIAIWNAASGSISVPWRFQGRMLESSASATDLYDFGARSYDPSLGAFTAFDSVAGSAQNPLTLNRYLYANANPATLVDPDGHCNSADHYSGCNAYSTIGSGDMSTDIYNYQHPVSTVVYGGQSGLEGTTDMTTSVYNYQHPLQNTTDMTTSVYNSTHPKAKSPAKSPQHHCGLGDLGQCAAKFGEGFLNAPGDLVRSVQATVGAGQSCLGGDLSSCDSFGKQLNPTYVGTNMGITIGSDIYNGNWDDLSYMAGGQTFWLVTGVAVGKGLGAMRGAMRGVPEIDPAGACSFRSDTLVATTTGAVAISSIRVSDSVMAYDPKSGETGPHTVTAVSAHTDPVVEHLALDSGPIETTPNHPFFTADRAWVLAGDLVVGEQIRTELGHNATVVSFTVEATPTTMWDLTVDGAHSFFVGSGAVLVHNCGPAITVPKGVLENHVQNFHTWEGGADPGTKSIFQPGTDLSKLIDQAQGTKPFLQPGNAGLRFHVVVTDGPVGGLSLGGPGLAGPQVPTSIYTVVTDTSGHLVSMYPGLPTWMH